MCEGRVAQEIAGREVPSPTGHRGARVDTERGCRISIQGHRSTIPPPAIRLHGQDRFLILLIVRPAEFD